MGKNDAILAILMKNSGPVWKWTQLLNKTKDWALVQNAALVGVEVKLGLVR